jgi:hypothetical protein
MAIKLALGFLLMITAAWTAGLVSLVYFLVSKACRAKVCGGFANTPRLN